MFLRTVHPTFTGAFADYRSTGKWIGKTKNFSMYQLIDHIIHLEFLESDVPFSKAFEFVFLAYQNFYIFI